MLTEIILLTVPFVLILASVIYEIYRVKCGDAPKSCVSRHLICFVCILALSLCAPIMVNAAEGEEATAETAAESNDSSKGMAYLSAAIVTGLAGIGGGIAIASAAPAAIGATAEDPKSFGKSLIFVALGEGIALYGLLVSILILNKV